MSGRSLASLGGPLFCPCVIRCCRLADDFLPVVVSREGPTARDDVKVLEPLITHHSPHDGLQQLLNAFCRTDVWSMTSPSAIVLCLWWVEEVDTGLLGKQDAPPVLHGPFAPRYDEFLPPASQ